MATIAFNKLPADIKPLAADAAYVETQKFESEGAQNRTNVDLEEISPYIAKQHVSENGGLPWMRGKRTTFRSTNSQQVWIASSRT